MNSGAMGSGGFEVYDGGVITISNGGLNPRGRWTHIIVTERTTENP